MEPRGSGVQDKDQVSSGASMKPVSSVQAANIQRWSADDDAWRGYRRKGGSSRLRIASLRAAAIVGSVVDPIQARRPDYPHPTATRLTHPTTDTKEVFTRTSLGRFS